MQNSYIDDYSSASEEGRWITEWCSDPRNEFLIEVPDAYIYDDFNLFGLEPFIPHYKSALSLILDEYDSDSEDVTDEEIEESAELLYSMIHARFLTTSAGLKCLRYKVAHGQYGFCPRLLCANQQLIPCGLTEQFGVSTVQLYCPRCEIMYNVTNRFQGSFFFSFLISLHCNTSLI